MAQSGVQGAAVGLAAMVLLVGGGVWFASSVLNGPRPAVASSRTSAAGSAKTPDQGGQSAPAAGSQMSADVLFTRVSPAVVRVIARSGEFRVMQGSGFFVSRDGLLVTNHHVINGAEFVSILRADNTTVFAEGIVADDPDADLAILKVNLSGAPCLQVGPNSPPKIGTKVFAIGNPDGLTNTLSEGLISGVRNGVKDLPALQTSAPISHGSSGGPLLTADGTVVGVTTAMLVDGQNLNFAVPASEVRRLMQSRGELQKYATSGMSPLDSGQTEAFAPVWEALDKGRYSTASGLLAALRDSQDKNPIYWFATGFLHGQLHNTDLSITAYRKAISLKADMEPAWYNMGLVYQQAGRWGDAFDAFRMAARLRPRNAKAYVGAGFVLNQTGELTKAMDFFRKANELDPRDAFAYGGMSVVLLNQNRFQDAIAACQNAISLKPDYAYAYLNLGFAYSQLHRQADARTAWQNAMRFDPSGPAGRAASGLLWRSQGTREN